MRKNKGFYFNKSNWEITLVEPKAPYIRVPAVAMLLLAPMLGALFVIFLPVIGFYMVGKTLTTKLFGAIFKSNEERVAE